MSSWRPAPAIVALQETLDEARPGRRDGRPDGVIGDADHSARKSDHNPDRDRLVCAVDVRTGPLLDDGELYDAIKAAGNLNPVKYAINNGRIWSPGRGEHRYRGENAHADHCHVSVTQAGKNRTAPWHLPGITDGDAMPLSPADQATVRKIVREEVTKAVALVLRGDKTHPDHLAAVHEDTTAILKAVTRS